MTSNTLKLNRLVVFTKEGKVAYDEQFHSGVNIIRGDNSSGKSTISHFIFYALGGAFKNWVREARECSAVFAEVELNEAILTLKRELQFNEKGRANPTEPMSIYWGTYKDAVSSPVGWQKFGYNTYPNQKSFSNVIFENLDLPAVRNETNVTMHQLLRLQYIDQESPTSSLFLFEQFDTPILRKTVAEVLLGVYDDELYEDRLNLTRTVKDLERVKSEIDVLNKVISDKLDRNVAHVETKLDSKEKLRDKVMAEVHKVRDQKVRISTGTKFEYLELEKSISEKRSQVASTQGEIRNLKLEIEDNEKFIAALSDKLKALKESVAMRDFLGELPLTNCPECLSPLEASSGKGHCKLCKQAIDPQKSHSQARRMMQELDFQIRESKSIQALDEERLLKLKSEYQREKKEAVILQRRFNGTIQDVQSSAQERVNQLYVKLGQIESELNQLTRSLERAKLYETLEIEYDELKRARKKLENIIEVKDRKQRNRLQRITDNLEKWGVHLLRHDLKRQSEFIEAKSFNIDFWNNLAYISDPNARYSASSSFYLKLSARYSLLLASLETEQMRFPRFILCDNMEDKGMEEGRVQNFQIELVKSLSSFKERDYQVIYTTSKIPAELNVSKYTVGDYYQVDNPTLKNV